MSFKKAVKKKMPGRLALCGPTGSGKTYSALSIAQGMLNPGDRLAVIDSERRSASKYADKFDFEVHELDNHSPLEYVNAIHDAADAGFAVLIIDSLSHAWMGKDGALEQVDAIAKRSQSGNSFTAWRDVNPLHNKLMDAILSYPGHVIVTMRSKMEYVMEAGEGGRKGNVRKVGLAPVQRDGVEYEFDVVGDMNLENEIVITKSRCPAFKGVIEKEPGRKFGAAFLDWLVAGKDAMEYVREGVANCGSLDALRRFKEECIGLGGEYWSDEAKGVFREQLDRLQLETNMATTAKTEPGERLGPKHDLPAAEEQKSAPTHPSFVTDWELRIKACRTKDLFAILEKDWNDIEELNKSGEHTKMLIEKGAKLGIEGYEA